MIAPLNSLTARIKFAVSVEASIPMLTIITFVPVPQPFIELQPRRRSIRNSAPGAEGRDG